MKRCIALVILACVLFVSIGIAEDSEKFVFRNGITWGMSLEDVLRTEGFENPEMFPIRKHFSSFSEVKVSGMDTSLVYVFDDNSLYACMYAIIDESINSEFAFSRLYMSLSSKYGTPISYDKKLANYILQTVFDENTSASEDSVFRYAASSDTSTYLMILEDVCILIYILDDSLINTDGL